MVRVGAPFQYGQFGGMLTIRKSLWALNFFGRVLLSKITKGLTPLPVFMQISDPNLKYSTALKRADALTNFLWIVSVGILIRIFGIVPAVKAMIHR